MRLAFISTTVLGIALLIGAVSYDSPLGAGASISADDIGDSDDDEHGGWPGEQDPQCGDQIGDDEDPGDTAPEDTPPPFQGPGGISTPTPVWDGDHDIELDDCFTPTLTPILQDETATPTFTASPSPTASPTATMTPLDLQSDADVDCDGGVDGSDAVTLLRTLSGAGGGVCEGRGDADCSGDVNSADVARILRITAGISDSC